MGHWRGIRVDVRPALQQDHWRGERRIVGLEMHRGIFILGFKAVTWYFAAISIGSLRWTVMGFP